MNAEALQHAAKTCRTRAQVAMQTADHADLAQRCCPEAGYGMRDAANGFRDEAIGLRVAASFMGRCARVPDIEAVLSALERGETIRGANGRVLCGCVAPPSRIADRIRRAVQILLPLKAV